VPPGELRAAPGHWPRRWRTVLPLQQQNGPINTGNASDHGTEAADHNSPASVSAPPEKCSITDIEALYISVLAFKGWMMLWPYSNLMMGLL
jgi:hypothetical protein